MALDVRNINSATEPSGMALDVRNINNDRT